MQYVYNFSQFSINEHKFWGKTPAEFINWFDSISNKQFITLDTETTGLPSDPYEIQLVQVGCTVSEYDQASGKFNEIDSYNKKIKLTPETKEIMNRPDSRVKQVLGYNRYGERNKKYHNESDTLKDLYRFVGQYPDSVFVAQNAKFDMRYLNTRELSVRFGNEVIDTMQVVQLFFIPTLQVLAETDESYANLLDKLGKSKSGKLVSSSLKNVGTALGFDMSGHHDAIYDCRLAISLLERVVEFLREHKDVNPLTYQADRVAAIRKYR